MLARKLQLGESVAEIEATREAEKHTSFMAGLFEAEVNLGLLNPFPEPQYTAAGTAAYERLRDILVRLVDANQIDKTGEIPTQVIRALREATAFGLKIPLEYGGLGLTQSDYHRIATLVGSWDGNLTALLSAHNSIGVGEPVKKFGTYDQKKRFLPRLSAGAISGFAITEPGAGTDITMLRKHAIREYRDGTLIGYRLQGQSLYTTNAAKNNHEFLAELLVVIARIVDDPAELDMNKEQLKAAGKRKTFGAFIVETNSPGMSVIRRSRFMGLHALYIGEVGLCDVFVPVHDRLDTKPGVEGGPGGGDGLRIAQMILTVGRLTLPAACLGGMKQLLNMLRCFAGAKPLLGAQRTMFGAPVGEHEANAEKVVRIAARTLALEAVVQLTGTWVDQRRDLRIESMSTKVIGSQWLWDSIDDALQVRGGRGYETIDSLQERGDPALPFERMMRDFRVNRIFEGANEAMRMAAVREGATRYVDGGKAMVQGTMAERVKVLAYFATQTVKSLNPITGRGNRWTAFLRREARTLTRVTIEAFVRYQQKLEKRQSVFLELSDYAMGLFLMAATLSYAESRRDDALAQELADWFCADMAQRLKPHHSLRTRVFTAHTARIRSLGKKILDGQAAWLEEGIIPLSDQLT